MTAQQAALRARAEFSPLRTISAPHGAPKTYGFEHREPPWYGVHVVRCGSEYKAAQHQRRDAIDARASTLRTRATLDKESAT